MASKTRKGVPVRKAGIQGDPSPADSIFSPTAELGSTGLRRFNGYIFEEFLRELSGPRGVEVFREMKENDPIVGSMLFAIEMLIRAIDWSVEPASNDPADQAGAEFVESCMNDMSQSWVDTIAEIISFLPYGWSYHEIVYKVRGGQSLDPTRNSRFSDGRIGWRKLPIRAQETLWKWEFDETGGIQGLLQIPPPDYQHRFIPIEKGLLFRTTTHKNNPEGRSILRNAYRPWFFKKRIENIEAIGVERDLAGLPIAWVPPRLLAADASPEDKAALEAFKRIVSNLKRDEQEGIVFPQAVDENGNKIYDLTLLSTGGTRQIDTSGIVNRYDQRIAMTTLADFIMLGHEKVGSFALSSNKTNLFSTALGTWCAQIAEVFNRIAIPRLFKLNGWSVQQLPKLVYGDIESVDLKDLAAYIQALSGAGCQLFPDQDLETYLKRQAGLPVEDHDAFGMDGDGILPYPQQTAAGAPQQVAVDPNALGGADLGSAPTPSDLALAGPQITSMMAIIEAVATRQMDRGTGVSLLQAGFNIPAERANAIMGQTGVTFFAAAPAAPAVPPPEPPK